jgi:hypothetical protein
MKTCSVCGKDGRIVKGMCMKHYTQVRLYGQVLERTKFDRNEIIRFDDCALIALYDQKNIVVEHAIIDISDVEKVEMYKWSMDAQGYVVNTHYNLRLHRFLMNPSDEFVIDHINRNPLDNRRVNLRICTQYDNVMNKDFSKCGVRKRGNRWQARIKVKGKEITIGSFATEREAISARQNYAI